MTRTFESSEPHTPRATASQSEVNTAGSSANGGANSHLAEYAMPTGNGRTASSNNPGVIVPGSTSGDLANNGLNDSTTSASNNIQSQSWRNRQTSTTPEAPVTTTSQSTTNPSTINQSTTNPSTINQSTANGGYEGAGNQNAQSQYYRQMQMRNLYEQQAAQNALYYSAMSPNYLGGYGYTGYQGDPNYQGYDYGSTYQGDPNAPLGYTPQGNYQTDAGYDYGQNVPPPLPYADQNQGNGTYPPIRPAAGPDTNNYSRNFAGANNGTYANTDTGTGTYAGTDTGNYSGTNGQGRQGHGRGAGRVPAADGQISNGAPDYTKCAFDDENYGGSGDSAGHGRSQRSGDGAGQRRAERSDQRDTSGTSGGWSQYDFAVYNHLKEQAQALVGHSIQEFDKTVPVRLGCARAVSLLVNKGYGFPVTDQAIGNLEQTLRKDGFTQVSLKDMKPGDVICGYRAQGDYPHGAVYMGNGQIFNNDSNSGVMQIQSIAKYNHSDFKRFVILRRPDNVPAVAGDGSAVAMVGNRSNAALAGDGAAPYARRPHSRQKSTAVAQPADAYGDDT